MVDHEDEELQMALRMSLQGSPPEAKRSKPRDSAEESEEARNRRLQRELLASAAEKRMKAAENRSATPPLLVSATEVVPKMSVNSAGASASRTEAAFELPDRRAEVGGRMVFDTGVELSPLETDHLFSMIFGNKASKNILAQWCNQGIRFSSDPETCIGLVQHEGGPCGVLATIQAFVLKYLLFFSDDMSRSQDNTPLQSLELRRFCQSFCSSTEDFTSITEDRKESIQADRDDPSLPLVTAPFGHASQEIVNLLLCGQAVPNVFDGRMDLGGGLSLKGISTCVEVGFLTLLESLNLCKVGRHLKFPKWPIWVVGSESHYTVLFALEPSVQEENELEERESRVRRAFDAQDQSGGGGFISYEALQQVLRECNISFPTLKLENLYLSGFIVWSELLHELLELDKSLGGLKDSSGSMGKKLFDIYHFNGIAKSVLNGNVGVGGETPLQRPRLCKLSVSVPPRWTQEEFLSDSGENRASEVNQSAESSQHAPLVDCIKTRWPRATCCWTGDAPSIV